MTVSIIVPMFHGMKYLNGMLEQIERCAYEVKGVNVELILYNDSPEEEIRINGDKYVFQIKVINPGYNSGIHGARVHALACAIGEWVLFLDQDDKIAPTYLKKQLECIGKADAVVCRVIYNNRYFYTNTHIFEKVITKDFILGKWNPIVSPGQVLLKKDSIPQLWKECIMSINGADDYFLWLLMVSEGKMFSLNQEVLFEHIETGMNTSGDSNNMMDSEAEMICILRERNIFNGEDRKIFAKLPDSLRRMHIRQLDNYKKMYVFLHCWNEKLEKGVSPIEFFEKNHISKIALYGAGDFGKNIEILLKNTCVKVCYYIDQNAEYIISELPVYRKENIQEEVDAIVITIDNKAVKKELLNIAKCPVYDLNDIWI